MLSIQSVVSKEVNIWESFYKSTVRERIESLISTRISSIVENLEANLKGIIFIFLKRNITFAKKMYIFVGHRLVTSFQGIIKKHLYENSSVPL